MKSLLLIGIGGFFGAIARHGFTLWFGAGVVPWGTVIANVLGCLLIGGLAHLFQLKPALSYASEMNLLLITGFLGSLTTFSTLIYQTFNSIRVGEVGAAMLSISIQLLLGMLLVWLGYLTVVLFFR